MDRIKLLHHDLQTMQGTQTNGPFCQQISYDFNPSSFGNLNSIYIWYGQGVRPIWNPYESCSLSESRGELFLSPSDLPWPRISRSTTLWNTNSRYHESQYSSKLCFQKSLAKVDQIVREGVLHEILIISMTHRDSILVRHLDHTIYMESRLLKDEGLKLHGIYWHKGPLVWVPYTVWGSWRSSLIRSMIDIQMS